MNGSSSEKQSWLPMEVPPDLSGRGIFIGTSGYYYDDWIGIFNPPKLTAKSLANASEQERRDQDRLWFYQNYFSFVEINHTFYREPLLAHFIDIGNRSRESMKISVKVHKEISHTRSCDTGRGCELMERYIAAVSPLAESGRFFSFLVQLEDHWYRTQQRLDYLCAVCGKAVSRRLDVHIEFRHASWHAAPVLQSLKDAGIGICNTDIPRVKHAFPLKAYATSGKGYVRYSGRNQDHWYPRVTPATAAERIAQRNARYDYAYSEEEMRKLLEGQLLLIGKTDATAAAYNNHYKAKAIRNAIDNIVSLKRLLDTPRAAEKLTGG